jgi:hypothetical protein
MLMPSRARASRWRQAHDERFYGKSNLTRVSAPSKRFVEVVESARVHVELGALVDERPQICERLFGQLEDGR